MDIKTYTDALVRQQTELKGYISTSLAAVPLPSSADEVSVGKKNFLTSSGWTFNVLGIIAFIAGLLVGVAGIWITGCAAILSGCYCIAKGRQQLRLEAWQGVGEKVRQAIDRSVAHLSNTWTGFVTQQNNALRRDIVTSAMTDDDKVRALAGITDGAWLHVDLKAVTDELAKADAAEDVSAYKACMPAIAGSLTEAVDLAAKALGDVYRNVPAAKAAASAAPKSAK